MKLCGCVYELGGKCETNEREIEFHFMHMAGRSGYGVIIEDDVSVLQSLSGIHGNLTH